MLPGVPLRVPEQPRRDARPSPSRVAVCAARQRQYAASWGRVSRSQACAAAAHRPTDSRPLSRAISAAQLAATAGRSGERGMRRERVRSDRGTAAVAAARGAAERRPGPARRPPGRPPTERPARAGRPVCRGVGGDAVARATARSRSRARAGRPHHISTIAALSLTSIRFSATGDGELGHGVDPLQCRVEAPAQHVEDSAFVVDRVPVL